MALGSHHRALQFSSAQELEPSAFLAADIVHDISVEVESQTFQAMVEVYQQTEEKEWVSGTVTIDGSTYEQVGLRLKGNSSLRTLLGQMGPRGNSTPVTPESVEPTSLPWLIRLDEYVNDQNHDGMEQLVIRSNNTTTSLNEAIALSLLDRAGLASQQAAAVRFSVNNADPILRLAIENPKGKWMKAHFPADGTLFKAEAEGDWSYRGNNYEDYYKIAFDLEAGGTGDDGADFVPVIEFLDFLNNSDDTAFVQELPERLDVDQFAVYLAMMDLIANTDDIDGPGNNSYQYRNRETEQFTIVPWDMNLAFGGFSMMGQSLGGDRQLPGGSQMGPDGQGQMGRAGQWPTDGMPELTNEAGTPVVEGEFPFPIPLDESGTPMPIADSSPPAGEEGFPGRGGGFGGGANPLVTRFLANSDWSMLHQTTAESLRADLYESGVAMEILDQWVALLKQEATDLVDNDTIESEASAISAHFEG